MDWVGRPEQTNVRLNNSGLKGVDDIRDLWNQQTPFAIDEKLRPVVSSASEGQPGRTGICATASRTGRRPHWPQTPICLSTIFCCLTSQSRSPTPAIWKSRKAPSTEKPIRPVAAVRSMPNVIDILLTWIVNRDREFLEGGTTKATKPGTRNFPYLADAEYGPADGGGDRRCQRNARQGVGADRPVWRRLLASPDRGDSLDWNRPRSIAND